MFLSSRADDVSLSIKSTISINCSLVRLLNATISSTLFKNSGLKTSFNLSSILYLSTSDLPNPIELLFKLEPAFEVIIIIVFSKLTVFP